VAAVHFRRAFGLDQRHAVPVRDRGVPDLPARLLVDDARLKPERTGEPVERGLNIAVGEVRVDIHRRR
jgi:hypothetical protein